MTSSTSPFDEDGATVTSQDEALALGALREYADHDLQEPERGVFKQRLLDDPPFYDAAVTALKHVSDLLFFAGSFDDDDAFDLGKAEKAFRATVRSDPPEIRRMREYFLIHHKGLRMAVYLSAEEVEKYEQRVTTFLASYRERVALLPPA